MMVHLDELLNSNEVEMEEFNELIYQTLLLSLFEKIYNDFKENQNKKNDLLIKLRNSQQETIVIKKYSYEVYNVQLTDHGASTIYQWLLCFFRKNGIRQKYDNHIKTTLITKQNNCCNACKNTITIDDSELDHRIPWVYVGDELEENLQMLCTDCNRSKNKSITFLFSTFLMRHTGFANTI